ncbi:hypothetical protein ACIO1C_32710 [Streptomyces sp. NPDC087420]|uniref:hypothetical protein n=1 Tax=Streptomyces sp. NPDC087420 TaxID=3365785 RepID=UPI003838AABD
MVRRVHQLTLLLGVEAGEVDLQADRDAEALFSIGPKETEASIDTSCGTLIFSLPPTAFNARRSTGSPTMSPPACWSRR